MRWEVLHLDQFPELRLLEWRGKHSLKLLAFSTRTGKFLCMEEYPGVVYNLHYKYDCVKECRVKFIKQSLAKAANEDVPMACGDHVFAKKCPALFEFVTCGKQEDGSDRKTSTITICYFDGAFKAFLNDRDSGMSTCVTAPTITALWDALESRITSSEPGWRAIPQGGQRRGPQKPQKKT